MTVVESKGPWFGIRHVQTLLIFLNITVVYISRLNIAVAVVAMTNAESTNPNFPEYNWNEKHKSYIISSFYWGYVVTQFPGGYLARRFGCKIIMFFSTFGSSIFSLITPFCVPWGGWQVLCVIRIMQGLFQGVMFPCIHEHLAKWSPLNERNRLGALSHTGIECGTVLAMAVSGLIAASPMGWPGISYISAALCFSWCALWLIFGANNAPASRFITQEERYYIESSLQRADGFHQKKIPVPWRAIFASVPFYALLVARCAEGWGFSTIQAEIPSYMNGVLKMDIKSNALFSALPYLVMWIMSYVYLIVADAVMKNKWTSLTILRRTFNTIAFWIPALGLIGVGFLDERHKPWAIALMTLNVGVNSGATIGSSLNTIDLSPNHAGILMGIVNCIANFTLLLTPLFVGMVVHDVTDRTQWQIVFLVAALIFFVGNLIYIFLGTAEVQPWNEADYLLPKDAERDESSERKPSALDVAFQPSKAVLENKMAGEKEGERSAEIFGSTNTEFSKTDKEESGVSKAGFEVDQKER